MTGRRAIFAGLLLGAGACARSAPPPAVPAPVPEAAAPAAAIDSVERAAAPSTRPRMSRVTFAFTGDINLGTTTLPDGIPPDSGRGLLDAARPHLAGDLVIGNLEGVFADTGVSEKCIDRRRLARMRRPPPEPPLRPNCYAFRTPSFLAPRLREAGFTHLNLANNHSGDLGPAGRRSTLATIARIGITAYGPRGRIAVDILERADSVSTVGLIGFTTYPFAYSVLDIEESVAVVDSVRKLVDVLVVTFHAGREGAGAVHTDSVPEFLGDEPRGDLRRWARAVVDAGADAVVGHGPHVLRGIEFHRGRLIAYSLGNFATYRGFSLEDVRGLTGVLQLELTGSGTFLGARFVPMIQRPRRGPAPDPTRAALRLLRSVSAEDFGATSARISDDGTIVAP